MEANHCNPYFEPMGKEPYKLLLLKMIKIQYLKNIIQNLIDKNANQIQKYDESHLFTI